jgi:hypothetical protein
VRTGAAQTTRHNMSLVEENGQEVEGIELEISTEDLDRLQKLSEAVEDVGEEYEAFIAKAMETPLDQISDDTKAEIGVRGINLDRVAEEFNKAALDLLSTHDLYLILSQGIANAAIYEPEEDEDEG